MFPRPFVDSRLFTLDSRPLLSIITLDHYSGLSTITLDHYSRLSIITLDNYSRLSTITLDHYSRLSIITLDTYSRPLLSTFTLDSRLLDTLKINYGLCMRSFSALYFYCMCVKTVAPNRRCVLQPTQFVLTNDPFIFYPFMYMQRQMNSFFPKLVQGIIRLCQS